MADDDQIESIEDAIIENATGPLKATGDSGSIEQHPLPEQLDAARQLRSNRAASKGLGFRLVKLIPPGQE